jgi:DNA-binding SARP family transcriptional activator
LGDEVHLQLCGRLVVRVGDCRLENLLPSRQGRLLFVYLAVNRLRPVHRDELIEAIWGEQAPATPEAALAALVSRLRRVLGAERMPAHGELRLVLPDDVFIDLEAAAEAIHRAESAVRRQDWAEVWAPARVALHTALRGFLPGEDAPWVEQQQRRLEEMVLRSYECIAASGLELGGSELDAARRAGTALMERMPYRESGYRYLMEVLHREGNDGEALMVYERLRSLLRDDLGADPSRATQEFHQRLLGVAKSGP